MVPGAFPGAGAVILVPVSPRAEFRVSTMGGSLLCRVGALVDDLPIPHPIASEDVRDADPLGDLVAQHREEQVFVGGDLRPTADLASELGCNDEAVRVERQWRGPGVGDLATAPSASGVPVRSPVAQQQRSVRCRPVVSARGQVGDRAGETGRGKEVVSIHRRDEGDIVEVRGEQGAVARCRHAAVLGLSENDRAGSLNMKVGVRVVAGAIPDN